MKPKPITLIIYFIAIMLCIGTSVTAQKLPNVQTKSIIAPAAIKIDGKATEWNNQFEAYNTAADVWYTMANDKDNLYLVIQASTLNMINTIAGYGLELAIHKSGKNNDADKISITYPVPDKSSTPFTFGRGGATDNNTSIDPDEVMKENNKIIDQKFKWIIVKGIPGIDTLSVYNNESIIVASRMDNKKVYTLELAVPLKKLGLAVNSISKFSYHITIIGYTPPKTYKVLSGFGGPEVTVITPEMQQGIDDLNMRIAKRNPHVDFWGEYTLAK